MRKIIHLSLKTNRLSGKSCRGLFAFHSSEYENADKYEVIFQKRALPFAFWEFSRDLARRNALR